MYIGWGLRIDWVPLWITMGKLKSLWSRVVVLGDGWEGCAEGDSPWGTRLTI